MKVKVRPGILKAQHALRERRDRCEDSGNRRGRSYAFTSLTPILPAKGLAVDRALIDFENNGSPFARMPEVHCARLVVIDQLKTRWPGVPRPTPRLNSQYLLFTADLTAPYAGYTMPDDFLAHMFMTMGSKTVASVWGRCRGYPEHADAFKFTHWLKRSQLDTSLYFAGYPDVTPSEVAHALAVRDELIAFVQGNQRPASWAAAREAYVAKAEKWFASS